MSILDLQGMQGPIQKGAPAGSHGSKGCNNGGGGGNNQSTISLLCDLL